MTTAQDVGLAIYGVISDDQGLITYRPKLNALTGSVTTTRISFR